MPSDDVINIYKTKFTDTLKELAQQSDSRLRSLCMEEHQIPENYAYERVGLVEPRKLEGRVQAVTLDSITHDRRWLEKEFYVINLPVDEKDLENMRHTDPRSAYAQAINYGFNRLVDRVIYTSAFATIKTGKTISTSTLTAALDGVITITATGSIDYTDLTNINRNWVNNEVGLMGSNKGNFRKALVITGDEEEDLLQQAQLTSGDYDRRYQLEKGELVAAVGIEIIKFGSLVAGGVPTQPGTPVLLVNGSSQRECLAIAEGGVFLGFGSEYELKVQERVDLESVWQIKGKMSVGGVRTEGNRIQKVLTTPN